MADLIQIGRFQEAVDSTIGTEKTQNDVAIICCDEILERD